jgi:hypothetical protein
MKISAILLSLVFPEIDVQSERYTLGKLNRRTHILIERLRIIPNNICQKYLKD